MSARPLLEVRALAVEFGSPGAALRAVDGVDLVLRGHETLGLIGESGSGKTLTALALLGVAPSAARVTGQVLLDGEDLAALPAAERRGRNGKRLAMAFQEPASAFNPVFTIGEQIAEVLRHHAGLSRGAAWSRAVELLAEVGIGGAAERARAHPHELSGGQRQRAMIAMALACGPSLLIADEPTSALDVTLQAEILALLERMKRAREMSLLLISHDLGVVAEAADRVAVMYAGKIVEEAGVLELFARPAHPYTSALLASWPGNAPPGVPGGRRLATIPGSVPGALERPSGCRFRNRCPLARERCAREEPALVAFDPRRPRHRSACFHAGDVR